MKDTLISNHKYYLLNKVGVPMGRLLGVFLYGSQNYNINTENSDVDTKAIYIPTLEEAILNKERFVKNYILPNGEHCELMDIRHWADNLLKQNINFVETLFTEHGWINDQYRYIWMIFFSEREYIARYNINYGINSAIGQAIHTLKNNPSDPKKVANALRIEYFLERYTNKEIPYLECIQIPDGDFRDKLIKLKTMTRPLCTSEAQNIIDRLETFKKENQYKSYEIDNLTKDIMMQGIIEIIKGENCE